MRTGIDILLDNAEAEGEVRGEAKGIVKSAVLLLRKGKSIQEIADLLDLSDEQIAQAEVDAGLKTQLA